MECAASKCANARWPLLCPRGIVHNVYVYAVADLGGFINEAQRNVKPDLLQHVPRDRIAFESMNCNLTLHPAIA